MKNKTKMIENADEWELNTYKIKDCSRIKCLYQLPENYSLGPQQSGGVGEGVKPEFAH